MNNKNIRGLFIVQDMVRREKKIHPFKKIYFMCIYKFFVNKEF